jgi:hypothetical protein
MKEEGNADMATLRKIPGEIDIKNFEQMTKHLDEILKELRDKGTEAKRVVSRLNDSLMSTPKPYFLGIVEDEELVKARKSKNEPDPGLLRFADDNPSVVYDQTVNEPSGQIVSRNWQTDNAEKNTYTDSKIQLRARSLGPNIGCHHQRFIAIRIDAGGKQKNVGTITVSFKEDPTPHKAQVEEVMKKWAQDENKSPLIKYLSQTFELNGPAF